MRYTGFYDNRDVGTEPGELSVNLKRDVWASVWRKGVVWKVFIREW